MKVPQKNYGGPDRRRAERIKVNFKAHWAGAFAERDGQITDLSTSGCFILTPDLVQAGESVKMKIQLPAGGEINLTGEVVYKIEEMGFAVHFTDATEKDRKQLEWLIKAEALLAGKKRVNRES